MHLFADWEVFQDGRQEKAIEVDLFNSTSFNKFQEFQNMSSCPHPMAVCG